MVTITNLPAGSINLSRPVVLIGLPGAGKSSMARALVQDFGWLSTDLDTQIEQTYGAKIPQIFQTVGQEGFRQLEAATLRAALDQFFASSWQVAGPPLVIAAGGGLPTFAPNHQTLRGATVVYLRVSPQVAAERLGGQAGRPLLAGNPAGRLEQLATERDPIYRQVADVVIDVDNLSAAQVAAQLAGAAQAGNSRPIWVNTASPYPVLVGRGLESQVATFVPPGATKIMVFHAAPLRHRSEQLVQSLQHSGKWEVYVEQLPDGEAAKNPQTLDHCWQVLARAGLGRKDLIVAMGGGALTDLAGFAAATWLRGIDIVQVPTSLLAMVDAAVGGKTGIDLRSGKNLVGAFHSPQAVICDLEALRTLPVAELRAGLVEALKCGFIRDGQILSLAAEAGPALLETDSGVGAALEQIIARAIAVKAQVVSADLRESNLREILNYGHTFGHAIEKVENFSWRHGEAVGVGMIYAAHLGAILGVGPAELPVQIRQVLQSWELPVTYSGQGWQQLESAMFADKKVRAGRLRFVLLTAAGNPVAREVTDRAALRQAAALVGVEQD